MRIRQQAGQALWVLGGACICYLLLLAAQAWLFRQRAAHFGPAEAGAEEIRSGALIGRLEIPQLRLSVPILEDDASISLLRGLGHIRGTAVPGGLGTVGLAGHRDTFLRSLRGVNPGMEILAANASGVYHYVVDSTEIVLPERVDVLAIRARPELTLITCYPFDYVGHAPKRFIVHAHLVSVSPDPAPAVQSASR